MRDPAESFFNDLPPAEAKVWAQTITPSPKLTSELSAWATLPCGYLVTTKDTTISLAVQEKMIARARNEGGVDIKEYRCDAGHSPHLSWTEGTVGVIEDFLKDK